VVYPSPTPGRQDSQSVLHIFLFKAADEKWAGRKIYHWLRYELNFYTRCNKPLSLSGIYRILQNPFYYGIFEYPRSSGNWYEGKHKPLISQELFDKTQEQFKKWSIKENKEFAFTKLITCGLCGSGITAEEKYKQLKDGTTARYVYYGCSRAKDHKCKNKYIREEDLIKELLKIIDKIEIDKLGMKQKLEAEVERYNKFQKSILQTNPDKNTSIKKIDIRTYTKYSLREGSIAEKRELLALVQSKLTYKDKKIIFVQ